MRAIVVVLLAGLACTGCQQKSEPRVYSDEVTDVALIKPPTAVRYKEEAPAADAAAAPAAAAAAADEATMAAAPPAEVSFVEAPDGGGDPENP